jgi:putative CocE/NonD family hydrolase
MAIQVKPLKIQPVQPNLVIYRGNDIRVRVKGYKPLGQRVPVDTDVRGVYFDGYPQIIKQEESPPTYSVRVEKDVMVPMRDGVRLATDIYRPDVEGKKFPAILSFAQHGKELQEMTRWLRDLPLQEYHDSPIWDGMIESGDMDYVVTRGYVNVLPEPRNIGKSEGATQSQSNAHSYVLVQPTDTYDMIEWIAKQPWCDGNVAMMGACAYSTSQMRVAEDPPPALKAIAPFLNSYPRPGNYWFTGIIDCKYFSMTTGRHGNDSAPMPENTPTPPRMFSLLREELNRRLEEALNHPDIKYNSKWYSLLKYPMRSPMTFDQFLEGFHPTPVPPSKLPQITVPTYLSTSGIVRGHTWCTFESYEGIGSKYKKLLLWPPMSPDRPFTQYTDEVVRWMDYFLKGIDTGIVDEPPLKIFVNGVNKWRFENEWPLARTEYVKLYLHPKGGLSTEPVNGTSDPDTFTQPAPYLDPTVYCLTYRTEPLAQDVEVTGYIALYLDAAIDINRTNWMVDLVDVDADGNKTLVSTGALAAEHRALDEAKSRPYLPIHPSRGPVPVPPGEVIEYAIALMPTAMVFKEGHSIELIIRNQEDLLSLLGAWGVHYLPQMQTVTHHIHFGKSHLLLPFIPLQ